MTRGVWPFLALIFLPWPPADTAAAAEDLYEVRCPGAAAEPQLVVVERPPYARSRARYLLFGTPPGTPEPPVPFRGESCAFQFEPTGDPDQRQVALCGELRFELDLTGPRAGEPGVFAPPAPAGRLAGRVEGPGGKPVGGAIAYLDNEDLAEIAPWRLGPSRVLSGADGAFSLPYYPGSRLTVLAAGFAPARWQVATLATAPAAFVLQPAERRRIAVFRAPGKPEKGVLVATAERIPLGFTSENGQLEVSLAPGGGLVFGGASGFENWQLAAPPWHGNELAIAVGGRVVDEEGQGIAGASVFVRSPAEAAERGSRLEEPRESPEAYSGEGGELEVAGIAAGEEVALEVRAAGFAPRLAHGIRGGQAGVAIALERGRRVEVLVRDEAGPVPEAGVWLSAADGPSRPLEMASDFYGGATLTASTLDGWVAEGTAEIAAGRANRLDLKLSRRKLELRGVLLDAAGRPAASHQVHLETRDGEGDHTAYGLAGMTITGADGSFRFEIARSRKYVLTAARAGEEIVDERKVELEVDLKDSQSVVLTLPP